MENQKSDFNLPQEVFIDMLSDGYSFDEVSSILKNNPYFICDKDLLEFYKNPEILREIIERGKNKLGQVWGQMWKNIKLQAASGSIPHAKILIDYVANGKSVPFSKLRVSFDESVNPD